MGVRRCLIIMVLLLFVLGSLTVFADVARATYYYGSGKNAKVYGFILFTEGKSVFPDMVSYNVNLSGTDKAKCTVAYEVRVKDKILDDGSLDSKNYSVSKSNRIAGFGHEYATLRLKFNGKSKDITSFAE